MSDIILFTTFCYHSSKKNLSSGNILEEINDNTDDSDNIMSVISQYIQPKRITISLIGLGGVGKSSFLERIINNKFILTYIPSNSIKKIKFIHNFTEFIFFDHGGQHIHSPNCRYFSRNNPNIDLIILMIDNTSKLSYKFGMKWLKEIKGDKKSMILVNKIDIQSNLSLPDEVIRISTKRGEGLENILENIDDFVI
jgi:GTPase SAR1 family protein